MIIMIINIVQLSLHLHVKLCLNPSNRHAMRSQTQKCSRQTFRAEYQPKAMDFIINILYTHFYYSARLYHIRMIHEMRIN